MQDESILELMKTDPQKSMGIIMDKYLSLVYSIVYNKLIGTSSNEDIEECVNDVFFMIYKNADSIDLSKGSIKNYLCVIAKRRAIDNYRYMKRRTGEISLNDLLSDISDGCSVENMCSEKEDRMRIASAINDLGHPDSEIIIRKYYLNENSKDIAAHLSTTPNAVDIRAHRALKKLSKILGGIFNE